MRKKALVSTTTNSNISRPSLIDTMLLTSTPLRRSPAIQSTTTSTRSATNLTLQQIFKEKNQTYEDMQLLNLTKSMNKKDKQKEKKSTSINKNIKKRSKSRKTIIGEEDDETENDQEIQTRKKTNTNKRKTTISKQQQAEEPMAKKLRKTSALNNKRTTKTPIGKSSAGSSDGCTTLDEENEETRLIEQTKLYIEGPGKAFCLFSPHFSNVVLRRNSTKL
jgi:DNA polymerase III alpha subunit (gram-positive type)